jgi:hypothetical protein
VRKLNLVLGEASGTELLDAEKSALALGGALPDTLEEIRLQGVHPSVLDGVCRIVRQGRVRVLELPAVRGIYGPRFELLSAALSAGAALSASATSLLELNLDCCRLIQADWQLLCSTLATLKDLHKLNLASNYLSDAGIEVIIQPLSSMRPDGTEDLNPTN